jgi:hypothetical protein
MQNAVRTLVSLGPLPASSDADEEHLRQVEAALKAVHTPLSQAEAEALLPVFGSDDCFGLAWSLLHIVETAPDIDNVLANADPNNEWVNTLRERSR